MTRSIRSYVAIGDSFSSADGSWCDLLAQHLRQRAPELEYHKLAADGAGLSEVAGQAERAHALGPNLVTVTCGVVDVMGAAEPSPFQFVAARLGRLLSGLSEAAPSALVVTATYPDPSPFVPACLKVRGRIHVAVWYANEIIRVAARENGVRCVDLAAHRDAARRENFDQEGLQASTAGHRRAARAVAGALAAAA
jgi:GDSL-like Lipase/Acylhydrolase family